MQRRISKEGLERIKKWEGLKLKAYRNFPGEPWTIGYGSTGQHVQAGTQITEAEAEDLLVRDLARFEARVSRLVKVPLTDNQFAALVSFDFNTGALDKSTLLKKLNAGHYDAVPAELMKWVNAGGKRVQGLVNRRSAEAGLWAKGDFVSSNFIDAKPAAPAVITKENVTWGAGIVSSLGFAFTGEGPMQYALAAILVIAFAVGAYLFIRSRVNPT